MNILALSASTPEEIVRLGDIRQPYRAQQIFSWIARGACDFGAMSDLPVAFRTELAARFRIRASNLLSRHDDVDGTAKLRIGLADGAVVEAVLLTDGEDRRTACLSTQVGCQMGCVFCMTGKLGFLRNLSPPEIVDQFLFLRDEFGSIDNIVVMGMGEPLMNLENLRVALGIITHPKGLGLSPRRITVSTCGLVKGLEELTASGPAVRLAISLTSANPIIRNALMPITKTNPLPELKAALLVYQKRYGKRITMEIVLLKGINCSGIEAERLVEYSRDLDVVFNLIPWNPVDGLSFNGQPLHEPSVAEAEQFALQLKRAGLSVTERLRKGRGVMGACGQLGSTLQTV